LSYFIGLSLFYQTGDAGIGVPALGLKERPFGCCMITRYIRFNAFAFSSFFKSDVQCFYFSVGMFGIEEAFAPLTPFSRTTCLVLIGAMTSKAVVISKKFCFWLFFLLFFFS
jgi:hypothetical protein